MKAKHLQKVSEVVENIYKRISEANADGGYKIFIPHYIHVSENVKIELIENGYKVYKGQWDGITLDALIIEW